MSADTPGQPPSDETKSTESLTPQPRLPERIGKYRILQKLGEGGMGDVYLAEQDDPRRNVALKIIKWGMDTKQVIARFEAERQALALMDHPNIAKVFDAGATEQGRPYFVMEYVKGVPITEHCDIHRLTTKERLELFIHICKGVQHAHQKAVIHRDIKPSNVLVAIQDGKPVPKIIDFGIAKATAQRLTEKTMFTAMGVIVGTPEYMSPEQAELTGQDVDTRTDVYSLGVLCYELLVGSLPIDPRELREAGFDEIRRRIREEEPPKPSIRISTLGDNSADFAKRRHTDARSLARRLRGDLDWITMKALEKDRGRRYRSSEDFAADIVRHLRNEPVLASSPGIAYRTWKFARRHSVGVSVTAAALLLLVVVGLLTIELGQQRNALNQQANRELRERLLGVLASVAETGMDPMTIDSEWPSLASALGEYIQSANDQELTRAWATALVTFKPRLRPYYRMDDFKAGKYGDLGVRAVIGTTWQHPVEGPSAVVVFTSQDASRDGQEWIPIGQTLTLIRPDGSLQASEDLGPQESALTFVDEPGLKRIKYRVHVAYYRASPRSTVSVSTLDAPLVHATEVGNGPFRHRLREWSGPEIQPFHKETRVAEGLSTWVVSEFPANYPKAVTEDASGRSLGEIFTPQRIEIGFAVVPPNDLYGLARKEKPLHCRFGSSVGPDGGCIGEVYIHGQYAASITVGMAGVLRMTCADETLVELSIVVTPDQPIETDGAVVRGRGRPASTRSPRVSEVPVRDGMSPGFHSDRNQSTVFDVLKLGPRDDLFVCSSKCLAGSTENKQAMISLEFEPLRQLAIDADLETYWNSSISADLPLSVYEIASERVTCTMDY